jgi:hypothetical protein
MLLLCYGQLSNFCLGIFSLLCTSAFCPADSQSGVVNSDNNGNYLLPGVHSKMIPLVSSLLLSSVHRSRSVFLSWSFIAAFLSSFSIVSFIPVIFVYPKFSIYGNFSCPSVQVDAMNPAMPYPGFDAGCNIILPICRTTNQWLGTGPAPENGTAASYQVSLMAAQVYCQLQENSDSAGRVPTHA